MRVDQPACFISESPKGILMKLVLGVVFNSCQANLVLIHIGLLRNLHYMTL